MRAPSTLGSFLRAFTWGQVRQLQSAARVITCRLAAHTGMVPKRDEVVFVDIDSKVKQVYGPAKEGASFGYAKQRGRQYEGNGGVRRFQDYYDWRFGASTSVAQSAARYMLTMEIDPTVALGREFLISRNAGGTGAVLMPWMLPEGTLNDFCRGFADTVVARAAQEAALRSQYLANQKKI
ncbi:hypothetical protein [Streptomyces cadmiisoli]|uniref:hypothetical protein n=1 Tax=Streptomyces cadmiisoli TaxID=2184053 RepID=UPI003D704E35